MNGKNKCKILKQIRQQIAQSNEIAFVTAECKFQGDCTGTCPKCEQEVRYLEQQLAMRREAGKKLVVAGIAAAMLAGGVGCTAAELPPTLPQTAQGGEYTTMGVPESVDGQIPYETEPTEVVELMGDVAIEYMPGSEAPATP